MVLVFLWLIVAVIVGTFVLSFGFLKKPTGRDRNLQNPILQTQRYGETGIYKTNLFRNPSIIVCSPELCRKVLTDDEQFQLGYPLSSLVLDGMPSDYISGSGHKRFHRLTTSSLTRNEPLSLHIGSVEEIVTNALEECSKMKEPILFFHEMNKIAFKVIMTMFLGYATDDTVIASMEKSFTDLFSGLFCTPINIPGFAYHKAVKARKKLVKEIQGVLGEKRERKRNDPNSKIGLIDVIREAEDSKREKLDEEYIIIILVIFLIAGRETSGRAATWATMYLHHHPHVLQKAKEEQEKIMKRRPSSQKGLTLSEIKQMKYLSQVIDETLRRRTNVFALFREAKNDTHLNDFPHIGSVEEIVTNALEECSKMKEPILFFHEMNKIAFKVIMTMFLGYATDDTVIASMEKSFTDLFSGLFCTPINIPGFAYHKAVKARKKLVKEIQGVLGEKRERKRNDPNSKIGLIDVIREAEDSKREKLDEEYIIIILVIFLIAGRETSGRAATWATMYLHHHPHVLQKAKYFIPKGWKVLVWQSAVHMEPEIYPNPKEFLPSRWDGFKPKVGAFLPFGAGSSTCPGAGLAKLVISIFLHCFIRNYKLEQLNPGGPVNYLPCSPDPADNCPAGIIKIR
ncbi:hypothetical protein GOBAR_AA34995 [Gossypium barbadense]|uniref:Cytochrome P450 n=1 Tax=Gossypium barbadense TaxID=3634 RepID=A0A2P5W3Q3_GOSBA|nr:hypothetical protein GOBAR_AA34995 [Gossypium barbadense]